MQRAYGVYRDSFGRPVNGATVTVFVAGTSTLASIYQASGDPTSPASQSNPFTTDATGFWEFAAPNGRYDIVVESNSAATQRIPNKVLSDAVAGLVNPMSQQGQMIAGGVSGAPTAVSGNSTATPMYLYEVSGGLPFFKQVAATEISGLAAFIVANGVSSFNGRQGAVIPASGDYTFAQIGSKPTTIAGYGITDTLTNTFNGRSGTVVPASGDYTAPMIQFTQAGTGATSRTSQDKLRERVSVLDFGAVSGGVTDSTSAFAAALAYAAPLGIPVYVPAGTWRVEALSVPSGTYLKGDGKTLCQLVSTTSANILVGTDVSNIRVENLWFHGANLSTGDANGAAIWLTASSTGCQNVLIQNCKFDNFKGSGVVRFQGNGTLSAPATAFVSNVWVLNNEFTGNYCRDLTDIQQHADSIYCAYGVSDAVFKNNFNDLTNAKTAVTLFQESYRITVDSNVVKNAGIANAGTQGGYGIVAYCIQTMPLGFVRDISITNNKIDTTTNNGIYVQGCANWIVAGNSINASDQHPNDTALPAGSIGINNGNSPHTGSGIVANNSITNGLAEGIQVVNYKTGGKVIATGNKIENCVSGLVARTGSSNIAFNSNTVTKCTSGIIYNNTSNIEVEDGVMTSGSPVLTSATGIFTAGMVGQTITVNGAGVAGAGLTTTVLSFTSSTSVTLNANASTSVTNAIVNSATTDVQQTSQQIVGNTIYSATTAIGPGATTGTVAGVQINDNIIAGATSGISTSPLQDSQISNNILTGITGLGISPKVHNCIVSYNRVSGSGTYGIIISWDGFTASPQVTLSGNLSSGFSTSNLFVASQFTSVVGSNNSTNTLSHFEINATSVPVSGNYRLGDWVWNTSPLLGPWVGWSCSVAGAPGTWVRMGRPNNIQTVTGAYTVLRTDDVIRGDATSAAFSVALPASPSDAEEHVVKKIDSSANTITVSGNGHNIDGAPSFALSSQYAFVRVKYDLTSTTWNIIGK